ncbi:NADH-quinone oxidoreductase subunit I [Clostridiales bacterium]|nr:NADH-quinone oxidoreductase subunit I [Clostridiales bacterium]
MKDILTEHGFLVIAAGAFLAEHSIFTTVATGRPDEKDKAAMEKFAEKCSELLNEKDISKLKAVTVPGTPGYDISSFKGFPIKPDGDETCIGCGKCAKICPQKAINADESRKTNVSRCIACGACIKNCPVGARDYHNETFGGIRTNFESMCALYRTPEMFFAE